MIISRVLSSAWGKVAYSIFLVVSKKYQLDKAGQRIDSGSIIYHPLTYQEPSLTE